MYEPRHRPLLPQDKFNARLRSHGFLALAMLSGALLTGKIGYRYANGLPWIDALLNAAMILSGMGPVDPLVTPAAKLFATVYSLFSGIIFIAVVGIFLAPIAHRMLHRFHLEEKDLK